MEKEPKIYKYSAISLIIVSFIGLFWILFFPEDFKYKYVNKGCVISIEWQPASSGGFGSERVDWGWFYVTDIDYVFKSQEVWEIGECVEVTVPIDDKQNV